MGSVSVHQFTLHVGGSIIPFDDLQLDGDELKVTFYQRTGDDPRANRLATIATETEPINDGGTITVSLVGPSVRHEFIVDDYNTHREISDKGAFCQVTFDVESFTMDPIPEISEQDE